MKRVVALVVLLTLMLAATASAELNGAIYVVPGATTAIAFTFSVSGENFVATILTFGAGGNGRYFLAVGNTDGASGSGQILSPQGFGTPVLPNGVFTFQVDGSTGTFTTTGLGAFLSQTSGNLARAFP